MFSQSSYLELQEAMLTAAGNSMTIKGGEIKTSVKICVLKQQNSRGQILFYFRSLWTFAIFHKFGLKWLKFVIYHQSKIDSHFSPAQPQVCIFAHNAVSFYFRKGSL